MAFVDLKSVFTSETASLGQTAVEPNFYETSGIVEFLARVSFGLRKLSFESNKPFDPRFALLAAKSVKLGDIGTVALIAAVLTLLRYATTSCVSKPLAQYLKVAEKHHPKWPEAVWKFLAYGGLWLLSLYVVVLSGRYDFLQNPLDIFKGFVFGDSQLELQVPSDIYWMYALQLGFYVHSVFATLFMDEWRKDSVMMLVHHALTISLLEASFLLRYYKVGALVLLIHDLSDVLLEFTKINFYLKDRHDRYWPLHEWLANLGFAFFAFSWAWLRLYWLPLKVLYTTSWGVYMHHRDGDQKWLAIFNVMLLSLIVLHIYWFHFILILLYRVATGKQREVEDTREFEETSCHQHEQ